MTKKLRHSLLFQFFAVYLLYAQRAKWMPLFDREKIQQYTLDLLRRLQPDDATDAAPYSFGSKLLGAFAAFGLGRNLLSAQVCLNV